MHANEIPSHRLLMPSHRLSSSLRDASNPRNIIQASANTASSLDSSQAFNSVASQSSVSRSKSITSSQFGSSRRNPPSENSPLHNFRPFANDESGFEYSAPGQRVQISFGPRSRKNRLRSFSFAKGNSDNSATDNSATDKPRPARGTGRALLGGGLGNSLDPKSRSRAPLLNTKSTTSDETPSRFSITNPVKSTTEEAAITTATPPTTTTTPPTTTTTTTTTITITTTPSIETSTTIFDSGTTDTTTTTSSRDLPRRRFRPIPRRRIISSSSSSSKDGRRHSGLFSVRHRGTPRHRPSVSVILDQDKNNENDFIKEKDDEKHELRGEGLKEEVVPLIQEEKVEKGQTPLEAHNNTVGSVDGRGSGKSISDGQPQRNNLGFVFPQRRDSILPFGTRLAHRRPNSPLTNSFTGPLPLTSGPNLPPTLSLMTLTNSQDLTTSPTTLAETPSPVVVFSTQTPAFNTPPPQASFKAPNTLNFFNAPTTTPPPVVFFSTQPPVFNVPSAGNTFRAPSPQVPSQESTSFNPSPPLSPFNMIPVILPVNMVPVVAPLNLPFVVAPVNPQPTIDPNNPPTPPSESLKPPLNFPSHQSTVAPRLQRLFPSRQLANSFTLQQNSQSSSSQSWRGQSSSTSTSQLPGGVGTLQQLRQAQSSNTKEKSTSSSSSFSTNSLAQPLDNETPATLTGQEVMTQPSLTPFNPPALRNSFVGITSRKPSSTKSPLTTPGPSRDRGRQLLSPRRRPTLRRPLTPITRPRSQVVQTPVSDEYIKAFPEVAAPEGFPGEDPEEDTIKEAIFELQRLN
ncbi:mucin-5AC-like [Homarus americanus]|uniref:mucin-5AC-like n=1 Tax=Homarus americanus TaxID=6706 RepID=UPI001C43D003|nr:mucin-5AC-like [Homarus americanus]